MSTRIAKREDRRAGILALAAAALMAAGCDGSDGVGDEDGAAEDAVAEIDQADLVETGDEPRSDPAKETEDLPAERPDTEEGAPDAGDADAEADEEETPPPAPEALTVNTAYDFSSGSYSVVDLGDFSVEGDIAATHPDAVARCLPGLPIVIQRFGSDSIILLDPGSPHAIAAQFTVVAGSNPVDMALLADGRGVVARNNLTTAAVVDLLDGSLDTEALDLAGFADADGIPEMSAVIAAGGRLFIALQRLDRATALWDPSGPGVVAVFDEETLDPIDLDPVTDVRDGITLTGANPLPRFQVSPSDPGVVLVGETGFYGRLDGGIEGFDAGTCEKTGFLVDEETLGGDLVAFAIVDGVSGYAIVSKPEFAGDKLVRFDPRDGTLTRDAVVERDAYTLTDLDLAPGGLLLAADRTLDESGVLVIDAATGDLVRADPVSTGIAPFSLCSLR